MDTGLVTPRVGPVVHAGYSNREGGCNFCDRYDTEHGAAPHLVWVVSGGHLEVRFCDPCWKDIRAGVNRGR